MKDVRKKKKNCKKSIKRIAPFEKIKYERKLKTEKLSSMVLLILVNQFIKKILIIYILVNLKLREWKEILQIKNIVSAVPSFVIVLYF